MRPRPTRRRLALTAALAACVAACPGLPRGGDWHTGTDLVCSDCHTMHNRSRGAPMRYDEQTSPAKSLLRNASTVSLCLYCHDGTNPDAPDVLLPVSYVGDPAGGGFAGGDQIPSAGAHDLGVPGSPYPGAPDMTLTCVTCHRPHGSLNYRNLRLNPSRSGAPTTPIAVNQTVRPNGTNPVQVYAAANLTYVSGFSEFCNDCHGSDPSGHPVGSTISSFPLEWAAWSRGDARTIPVNLAVGTVSVPRVPVQNPFGSASPSPSDQIFCLTCHKAHGTGNPKMVRMPDSYSIDSACLQCHDM